MTGGFVSSAASATLAVAERAVPRALVPVRDPSRPRRVKDVEDIARPEAALRRR
ncbi:hypothetical protein ACWCQS_28130 [Streptomyces sp. NPDC002076]